MMMEIVLSEEKAKQFNYSIEKCYETLDQFFKENDINKISKGVYHCDDYGLMACAQVTLPTCKWFMNIVESWYCRYASDDISAREDCYHFYFHELKTRPYYKKRLKRLNGETDYDDGNCIK